MTERKPPGVSWESWLEEQIRRAREDGAFDNLAGAGKPFSDLEGGYDPDWWVKKLVQRERVSMLPPALELLRKVESDMNKIWALGSEADVRARVLSLNAEIARSKRAHGRRSVHARGVTGPRCDSRAVARSFRRLKPAQRNRGITFSPKWRIDSMMDACGM